MGKSLLHVTLDLREQAAIFGAMGKEIDLAGASVINKALMKTRTECVREIAATAKVSPISLIRRRMKLNKARPQLLVGALRLLVGDISVAKLTGLRDTGFSKTGRSSRKWSDRRIGKGGLLAAKGRGVFAYGGRSYPHAWVAEGIGGNTLVFERKGKARRPLMVHKVPIKDIAREVLMRRIVLARDMAAGMLEKEVAWRLSKRG
jgi:hypothetical protein